MEDQNVGRFTLKVTYVPIVVSLRRLYSQQTVVFESLYSDGFIRRFQLTVSFRRWHSDGFIPTVSFRRFHSNGFIPTELFRRFHSAYFGAFLRTYVAVRKTLALRAFERRQIRRIKLHTPYQILESTVCDMTLGLHCSEKNIVQIAITPAVK